MTRGRRAQRRRRGEPDGVGHLRAAPEDAAPATVAPPPAPPGTSGEAAGATARGAAIVDCPDRVLVVGR